MDNNTITVNGVGNLTAKPDYVVIALSVEESHKKYEVAAENAGAKIRELTQKLCAIGFAETDIKTTDYRIQTDVAYKTNRRGVTEAEKKGYTCIHRLKLNFDFDNDRLCQAVETICGSIAEPKLNVTFTMKDREAVLDKLLQIAASGALKRAKILAEGAGGKLGKLIGVTYNWKDVDLLSPTRFMPHSNTDVLFQATAPVMDNAPSIAIPDSFTPDNIELNENAVFQWELC